MQLVVEFFRSVFARVRSFRVVCHKLASNSGIVWHSVLDIVFGYHFLYFAVAFCSLSVQIRSFFFVKKSLLS